MVTAAAAPAPAASTRRPLRSAAAVFAGLVAIFVTSMGMDAVMHATGVFPPMDAPPMSHGLFALAFAYRLVFDVGGCYLTARLAPSRPMLHALVLGGIGLVLSVLGAIAMWEPSRAWYPVLLAASSVPSGWLGGWLAQRR